MPERALERVIVDTFEIPEELAQELSELNTTIDLRRQVLPDLIGTEKYQPYEKETVKLLSRRQEIMSSITRDFVPEKYRTQKYSWNYNGYAAAKNSLEIFMTA